MSKLPVDPAAPLVLLAAAARTGHIRLGLPPPRRPKKNLDQDELVGSSQGLLLPTRTAAGPLGNSGGRLFLFRMNIDERASNAPPPSPGPGCALRAGRWALGAGRCTAKSNSNWLYIKLLRQGPSQRHDGPIRQPSSRILTAFCSQAPPWEQRWLKLKYAHTWVSVCVGV